ncbi:hypothetical protein M408DRAFT_333471 [Serendipita vermifera MAFF 305830]|uniref:Uncharacterized protein n=1 Tax=Serendipita vermifera MAFF 305830 TaxID=933852 RepID=A0A0C3AQA5_SERVB|nr:hypothetical protein M408DRAFT_333471 [Serendipita vermifera MAFF 305830]
MHSITLLCSQSPPQSFILAHVRRSSSALELSYFGRLYAKAAFVIGCLALGITHLIGGFTYQKIALLVLSALGGIGDALTIPLFRSSSSSSRIRLTRREPSPFLEALVPSEIYSDF